MLLLSIVIPTYNRFDSLEKQLLALDGLGAFSDDRIEVVVGDNASTDGTRSLVSRLKKFYGKNYKPISYREHLGTAEENIARVVRRATGEYVWLLSDDDVIVKPTYYYLLEVIERSEADCYVFDNVSSLVAGEECVNKKTNTVNVVFHGVLSGIQASGKIGYEDFIASYGVTSYGALISRYVMRKECLVGSIDNYASVARIYSHVFGFLEALSDKTVEFVSSPLIFRRESVVLDRFEKLAEASYGYMLFPWTAGLVSLASEYEVRKKLDVGWLGRVREIRGDGSSYYLIEEVFNQLCRQIIFSANKLSSVQLMCANDLRNVCQYLRACGMRSSYLRKIVLLNLQLRVELQRKDLGGRVDESAVSSIIYDANMIISLPFNSKLNGDESSSFIRKAAVLFDEMWVGIRENSPASHAFLRKLIFGRIVSRFGVARLAAWIKRLAY